MDEACYMAVCEGHMASFYRMAYSLCGNRHDAEDAVQQALMKAWRYREKARQGAERAYIMRILINECHGILRGRKRQIPVENVPVLQRDSAQDVTDDLNEAIRTLPEPLRTPVLLKYMEGMSEQEVALTMHLPVSSVKSRLYRARRKLQQILTGEVDV